VSKKKLNWVALLVVQRKVFCWNLETGSLPEYGPKNIYLHPKRYPEQRQSSITNKVVRPETVQEEELIPPRVPSPRAGTSASFRSIERIREPSKVQIIPQSTSRKGKAWVRPPIVQEVILLSKLSEENVSSENEYVNPIHKVEFFYVKKDLHISKEAK